MALICAGMKCPICRTPLGTDNLFGTWGVFLPDDDPLCQFCDAGMHWSCYEIWPDRPRFAKAYFDFWVEHEKLSPYWGKAFLDDLVFITTNPDLSVNQVSIRLSDTGSDLRIPLTRWLDWLDNPEIDRPLHALEREALAIAIPRLRQTFPDGNAIIVAVDWDSKRKIAEGESARRARIEEARLQDVATHNKGCWKMELQRKHGGLTCLNCGQHSDDFRYMDNAPLRKSYFICNKCAHTIEPQPKSESSKDTGNL